MTNPAQPPQAAKRKQWRGIIILLVVGGLLFGGIWYATRSAATNAKVGDCLHQTGPDELKIVKCDSTDADYTVLGKVGGKDQIEATVAISSVCDQWPDSDSRYWQGEQGKKGDVLCLKATKATK
jgi:hypothetical protein